MMLAQQRNKTYLWSASLMLLAQQRNNKYLAEQAALRMKTKGTCCFSAEQAASRMKTKDCLARNLSVHRNVTCKCSHHDIADNCWLGAKQQPLTHLYEAVVSDNASS
jgi:hypothetical protein